MKLIKRCFVLSTIITLPLGCQMHDSSRTRGGAAGSNASSEDYVWVTMTGDVRIRGRVQMKREFSLHSLTNACQGWGHVSDYNLKPVSFTLKRVSDSTTNTWKIRFDEMRRRKWKQFFFEEGDSINVNTLYF